MKKLFLTILIALTILVGAAYAGTLYWEKNALPYWTGNLCSSQSTTGTGTAQGIYYPFSTYGCTVQVVSIPTSTATTNVNIEGSIDGSTYTTIGSAAVSNASTSLVHITGKTGMYIRSNFVSFSSATTTPPTITVNCVASH